MQLQKQWSGVNYCREIFTVEVIMTVFNQNILCLGVTQDIVNLLFKAVS